MCFRAACLAKSRHRCARSLNCLFISMFGRASAVRLMPAMFAECAVCEAGAVFGPRAVRLKNLRSLDPAAAYLVFRDIRPEGRG